MDRAKGVEALVLAAGASVRLGVPKALLEFDGRSSLERILSVLRGAGIERGAIVLGKHADEIVEATETNLLEIVRNPRPEAGRLGSIRVGVAATSPESDLLVWPVDRPLARLSTVRAILAVRERRGVACEALIPVSGGRRGHPFLLRSAARGFLTAAPADANLREILRRGGCEPIEVPVDDPGVHFNLDTRDQYEEALAWWKANERDA